MILFQEKISMFFYTQKVAISTQKKCNLENVCYINVKNENVKIVQIAL